MKTLSISLLVCCLSFNLFAQVESVVIDTTSAGKFQIKNAKNTKVALNATTNGSGIGVVGANTATSGLQIGVKGTSASSSVGVSAKDGVTGVLGQITSVVSGNYSAGVRGINNGTSDKGIGVVGYQAGSGWGVYGTTPDGIGVYGLTTGLWTESIGVKGETKSEGGVGVKAMYSGLDLGTALEIDNGLIKLTGNNKAAFVHIATPANKVSANGSQIDNPICNNDPNCLIFVTQKLDYHTAVYNNSPVGVFYDVLTGRWSIFNENLTMAIPDNAQFNVLVFKQ